MTPPDEKRDPKNTVRILDALSDIKSEMGNLVSSDYLDQRLKPHVTYRDLVPWIGGAAVVIVTIVMAMTGRAVDKSETASSEAGRRSEVAIEKQNQYVDKALRAVSKDINASREENWRRFRGNKDGRRDEPEQKPRATLLPEPPAILDGGK